jgi:hypothetical protein
MTPIVTSLPSVKTAPAAGRRAAVTGRYGHMERN